MFSGERSGFLVLDDTILLYKGHESEIVVPGQIDGNKIRTIGAGAINNRSNISKIEVSEGIETIGKKGLGDMYGLRKLVLPQSLKEIDSSSFEGDVFLDTFRFRLRLDANRYNSILAASYADNNGNRIIDGIPSDISSLSAFNVGLYKKNFGLIKPIAKINRDVRRIFIMPESKAFSYNLIGGESGITEADDLIDKIRGTLEGSYFNPVDSEAEKVSDNAQRKGEDLKTGLVLVPYFDERNVDSSDGFYELMIELKVCKAYWISVQRVVDNGVSYFTKSYCYYTSNPSCPYISLPTDNFYDERGELVSGSLLAARLRRKSRFLNMI
ncbi:leucine-rich repeat protein [Butyrivibrio sp. VCB2006]|uniref:leucine-rich repeat protein n=1 Tax=Butyrivibrio sp. VCB2006 TaxID=1280679 RepID=UPI0003F9F80D|nr:leucine-rich repeat protein [Butyrivibrio sp. VCB2006]